MKAVVRTGSGLMNLYPVTKLVAWEPELSRPITTPPCLQRVLGKARSTPSEDRLDQEPMWPCARAGPGHPRRPACALAVNADRAYPRRQQKGLIGSSRDQVRRLPVCRVLSRATQVCQAGHGSEISRAVVAAQCATPCRTRRLQFRWRMRLPDTPLCG